MPTRLEQLFGAELAAEIEMHAAFDRGGVSAFVARAVRSYAFSGDRWSHLLNEAGIATLGKAPTNLSQIGAAPLVSNVVRIGRRKIRVLTAAEIEALCLALAPKDETFEPAVLLPARRSVFRHVFDLLVDISLALAAALLFTWLMGG